MGILRKPESADFSAMDPSKNPNKKLRLDVNARNNSPSAADDLWGQDDITAEEFDMLETQATQSHRAQDPVLHPAGVSSRNLNGANNQIELESMRQMQYELEGRIKLLTQSVEKTKKELYEEKLKKEKLVADKAKEFEVQESNLRKEIEKMKSAMQFKDQEMKSVYSKVHMLEDQLKEKQDGNSSVSLKRNAESFNKRFSFGTESKSTASESIPKIHRKSKLSLDTPLGQMKGSDLVSLLLCNKMPVFQSEKGPANTALSSESFFSNNSGLFTMSVVKMSLEQDVEELFEHYEKVLTSHIFYLQSLCTKSTLSTCKTSPLSARHKEIYKRKTSVISCLKDVRCFFLHNPATQSKRTPMESIADTTDGSNENAATHPLVSSAEQRTEMSNGLALLLKPLVQLATAETYPNGYNKVEEIELSLCSLLACSYNFPHKLLNHMNEFPVSSLLNVQNDTSCMCITLKIMVNLLNSSATCGFTTRFFEFLIHKANGCLICTICTSLLQVTSVSLEKCTLPLSLAIDFLSSLFSSSLFSELKIESSQCINEVN
ncbi:uncharacterized protein LOC129229552 isoform X2 [Uloborus diversus]|uniref:uncharacterized protein LOC129229552 isoform X2 n=1 Tax=Uloborus diversus TaxID=327109 RepID=UPI00240A7A21|nr:uncharacterized protein LOC129229552 isoform X2 [Uloborus diversus]